MGDLRFNAQLADVSLAATSREHGEADSFLAQLKAISTEGMGESDRLSHDMLVRQLNQGDEVYALKNQEGCKWFVANARHLPDRAMRSCSCTATEAGYLR